MKLLLLFLLSLNAQAYLSRDEVLKELKISSEKVFMDEPLSKEALIRRSHLIPHKEFLKGLPTVNKSFMGNVSELDKDLPDEIDWRGRDSDIKHQDDGKCTAYSIVGAAEAIMNKSSMDKSRDLSEWDLWHWYGQYSSIAAFNAFSKNRISDEREYPQYGKAKPGINRYVKIAKFTFFDDDINGLINKLAKGSNGVIAMATPNAMLSCPKSGVISRTTTAAGGGHAIAISGFYLDESKQPILILKNSWGKDCSDHGYQYLPVSICKNRGFYCMVWSVDEVDANPSNPAPNPEPMPKPQPIPEPFPVPPKPLPQPRYRTVCTKNWKTFWVRKCVTILETKTID